MAHKNFEFNLILKLILKVGFLEFINVALAKHTVLSFTLVDCSYSDWVLLHVKFLQKTILCINNFVHFIFI